MNNKEVTKTMNTVRTPWNDSRFPRKLGITALAILFASATVFAQDPAPRQAPAPDPQANQYPAPQANQYPAPGQYPPPGLGQQAPYGQQPVYPQPQYGQQPAYGQPQYGQQPAYGQPQYGQPRYQPQPQGPVTHPTSDLTLPAGTVISVRVDRPISTARNQAGDGFGAMLQQPLVANGYVIAQRGQTILGRVTLSEKAGRVSGQSKLGLELSELTL